MYLYFTNVKNENTDDNKELIEIIKNGTSYSGIGNLLGISFFLQRLFSGSSKSTFIMYYFEKWKQILEFEKR
jgi:hypothetical protein